MTYIWYPILIINKKFYQNLKFFLKNFHPGALKFILYSPKTYIFGVNMSKFWKFKYFIFYSSIKVWDMNELQSTSTFHAHEDSVSSVNLNPNDPNMFISCSEVAQVKLKF